MPNISALGEILVHSDALIDHGLYLIVNSCLYENRIKRHKKLFI